MRPGLASIAAVTCALAVALASAPVIAQSPSATISMTADRTQVQVGERFRLQVRLDVTNAPAPQPELPDLSAFEVLSQQVSRPMQFSFGFGTGTQMSQSTSVHTFLLRAITPGRFELAAPRARVGGREYVGNSLTIVVGGSAADLGSDPRGQQPPQNAPSTAPPTGTLDGAIYDDQVFLRTVVEPSEVYVGQQVTVTIYLYVRSPLRGQPALTREATTDGFWVHDLSSPTRSFEATSQVVGSTPFRVYVLRRFAAFPLREGTLTIGAPTLVVPMGNVFDLFTGQMQPDIERTGVPVEVTVRPLPAEGRPAGDVHVGQLSLEASLDRTQVPTGDAVTLTLRATGSGQVRALRIESPSIDGLRVLSPQTRDEINAPGDVVAGVRTYEWLVVPEREGTFRIPPFRVATFDPVTRRYGVAESAPLELVAAGNPVASAGPSASDAAEPSSDGDTVALGPVRTQSALVRGGTELPDRPWYPWALAAFPLAWLGLLGTLAVRRRVAARAAAGTPQRAGKEARKRLAVAEAHAAKGEARELYAALTLALRSVLEGRLGESIGSLTHRQLERRLVERGMDEGLAKRLVEELEGHEMVRFSASGAEPAEMQDALSRARALIAELDRFVPRQEES